MKIYFTGGETGCWQQIIFLGGGKNILLSFHKMRNLGLLEGTQVYENGNPEFIFLDSGAFSSWSSGVEVLLDDYYNWLRYHCQFVDLYAGLDVIGDWRGTLDNQEELERRGLDPLWTFHFGEPFDLLRDMVSKYDYLALGGVAQLRSDKQRLRRWLSNCFSIIKDDARVHGFAVTSLELLKTFPFYSTDSTSYLNGSKVASLMDFNPITGSMNIRPVNDRSKTDVRSFLLNCENNNRPMWRERVKHNVKEYLKLEKYITHIWKNRGIDWDQYDRDRPSSLINRNKYVEE